MIENKKASIILILNVLKEYSDDTHFLTQQDIINKVEKLYQISLERKSVGFSISLLEELGYDIIKGRHGGYALLTRDIDPSEVKYLVDAIFTGYSVPGGNANHLIKQIIDSNLSVYQRKDYSYIYSSESIHRNHNDELFLNIEIITEAIKSHKRIGFQYVSYDEHGKKIYKMDGFQYIVSPYYLINNFGRYYLLCNYREKYHALQTFRIDYMEQVVIKDDWDIKPINQLEEFKDKCFNITDYINEHVYMLGGETIKATLKLDDASSIRDLNDWFSKNARKVNDDRELIYKVKANEQALIYWIMQYGEKITVLKPQSLIDKILKVVHKSFDKYESK